VCGNGFYNRSTIGVGLRRRDGSAPDPTAVVIDSRTYKARQRAAAVRGTVGKKKKS
jgi:hypothetical protein